MIRISESNALMTDEHQCNVYNQSLINSYDLIEYINFYKKYLNVTSGKILDLGSGPCNFVIALCLEFPDLMFDCYENSDAMIKLARENIEKHNLSNRINIIKGNLMDARGKYDAVLITRVLHHIEDTATLWKNVNSMSQNVFALDLERPEKIESIEGLFKVMKQMNFDDTFINDTKHSFMAAYTKEEVLDQTKDYNYSVESLTNQPMPGVTYSKLIVYQKR